jgi:hypothetical protein
LADIFDEILREIAPRGAAGEKIRRQLLSLEQEIRNRLAQSGSGSFAELWDVAQQRLLSRAGTDDRREFENHLLKARQWASYEGTVYDCNHGLPASALRHLWMQRRKPGNRLLLERITRLVKALEDILQLDSLYSGQAHDAAYLRKSMGTADSELFDFQVMSQVLETAPVGKPLAEKRRRRIRDAIAILQSQRFVSEDLDTGGDGLFNFEFTDCNKAVAAFHQRLPDMAALIKAISIAELEISNRFDEQRHAAYYECFNANALGPEDLALFPSYLVSLVGKPLTAKLKADVLETLGSGLPFKILAQHDDILGPPPDAAGQLSFGVRGQQLAGMALGLNQVFVVQAASSSLYRLRESLSRGLGGSSPALFSIYSGAPEQRPEMPAPYLLAAAATESRAFPSFVNDPSRGEGQAGNFSLDGNPAVSGNWPIRALQFEDAQHHLLTEDLAFTFVDFVASDARHAGHFIAVPKAEWSEDMLPLAEFLTLDEQEQAEKIPYTLLLGEAGVLHRAVVDNRLVDAAIRCQDKWRELQERAGINNAHANELLAEAEAAWQAEKQQLLRQVFAPADAVVAAVTPPVAQAMETTPVASTAAAATIEPEPVANDEPWIETPRCTTCNECTQLNNRMFAYNPDMQAYIADLSAGTYRELVEAAETCQVAIIHPGKPRNSDEPGLDELLARAEPFL